MHSYKNHIEPAVEQYNILFRYERNTEFAKEKKKRLNREKPTIFYKNDIKNEPHRMLTPKEVLSLKPAPVYIQYQ